MLPVDFDGTIDIRLRPWVVFPLSALGTIVSGTPNSIACWIARFKRYCIECQTWDKHLSVNYYLRLLIYIQSRIQNRPKWTPKVL
jgi:hypothetical protein